MQNQISVQPVILCGGSGTRLWPLSRTGFPKQFLCLTGDESLFQQAARRVAGLGTEDIRIADLFIVTGEEHRFLAAEQLRESGVELGAALLEPVARNTAPALTLAALAALDSGVDPILVVTPADQTVVDSVAFTKAMHAAILEAAEDRIVILGITPCRAETGYGYIQAKSEPKNAAYQVIRFVEKPDEATARSYVGQGGYYWNSGMFVLKASIWLNAVKNFRPDIANATNLAWAGRSMDRKPATPFIRPGRSAFACIESESIDYAVIEKCPGTEFAVKMVPLDAGWSDLGAWDAVWEALAKDENGNVCFGDVLANDVRDTFVHASDRLVGLVGVDNLIVIETADAVLVADKSRSQDVKQIVSRLKELDREECAMHRKVHRPWGWYDNIDEGDRFKVKRIQVNPKASLSLQKHHHRAEHWVVVKGTAEITNGERKILLSENQSTYIPLGEVHRLANPGNMPLEIIEVQSGAYLGEDDIIRFEDTYGRHE